MKPVQVSEAHYVVIITVLCLLLVSWLAGSHGPLGRFQRRMDGIFHPGEHLPRRDGRLINR